MSQKKAAEYDPDDFDEETCPRCNGSGQTGLVGDECRLGQRLRDRGPRQPLTATGTRKTQARLSPGRRRSRA